jgi:DNA-binding response OmpR family regulator
LTLEYEISERNRSRKTSRIAHMWRNGCDTSVQGSSACSHDRTEQVFHLERLREQRRCSPLLCVALDGDIEIGRDQDYRHGRIRLSQRAKHTKTREVRHAYIGDDDVGFGWTLHALALPEQIDQLRAVTSLDHLAPLTLERDANEAPHVIVVFSEKHPFRMMRGFHDGGPCNQRARPETDGVGLASLSIMRTLVCAPGAVAAIVTDVLTEENQAFFAAPDVTAALRSAAVTCPSVVIVGGASSEAVASSCAQFRAAQACHDAVIVAVIQRPEDAPDLITAGVDDFVVESLDKEVLRSRLFLARRTAVRRASERDAAHEIDNPLCYVTANVDMALEEVRALRGGLSLHQIEEMEAMLHDARDGAARIMQIIGRVTRGARVEDPRGIDSRSSSRPAAVLVIDDERAIGVAIRRVLHDHDVTITTTAQGALDLLDRRKDFDVVLCSLTMPGMSGMDLHRALLERHPAIASRVVFTGGAFTLEASAFLRRVGNRRLEKPFDSNELREMIHTLVLHPAA